MSTITDDQGNVVATVQVEECSLGRFEGVILDSNLPASLVALLREFESLANDQVLPLLDEIEQKIASYKLFLTDRGARISRLQLWGENGIHFWIEF